MAKSKGMTKNCEVCGTLFKHPPSHAHVRTCSTSCGYQIRRSANKVDWIKLTCRHCFKEFMSPPSQAPARVFCSHECMHSDPALRKKKSGRASGDKNPQWTGTAIYATSAAGIRYSRRPREIEDEKAVRRNRSRKEATPSWADTQKMVAIYKLCKEMTEITSIKHHVDHIVPLTSSMVCGLHNEFNLQILPAKENLRKHNRHWPDKP